MPLFGTPLPSLSAPQAPVDAPDPVLSPTPHPDPWPPLSPCTLTLLSPTWWPCDYLQTLDLTDTPRSYGMNGPGGGDKQETAGALNQTHTRDSPCLAEQAAQLTSDLSAGGNSRRPPGRYRSAERGLGVKLTLSFPFVLAVSSPPPWPRQRFGSLAVAQCRPLGWQATRLSDAGLFLITKLDHLVHAKFGKSPQAAETNRNLLIVHKLFISWDFTGVPS